MGKLHGNEGKGKLYCAIDLHDKKMLCGMAGGTGKVKYVEFRTDDAGMRDLVGELSRRKGASECSEVWVAYEASGAGFLLADFIEGAGFRVSVIPPSHLPVSPKSRSNKTDRRDVKRIMDMLRGHDLAGGDLPEVHIADPELRDDRELVRRRVRLGEEITDVKNKIHGLLKRNGFRKPEGMDNWTGEHLACLKRTADSAGGNTCFALHGLIRELLFYEEEVRLADREMKSLSRSPRYARPFLAVTSIKGVGLQTAMVFLVELGDLSRFPNRRCLASYLGLVPRCHESGERDDRKGHISRMGPSRVRKLLNQAAWSMVGHDAYWREWFKSRTSNKEDRKRMIVAVMRRLAIIMWHRGLAASEAS